MITITHGLKHIKKYLITLIKSWFKSVILVISPIPWESHNTQIRSQVKVLTSRKKVIFLYPYTSNSKIRNQKNKNLFLLQPVLLKKYKFGKYLSRLDQIILLTQIIIRMLQSKSFFIKIYTFTPVYPKILNIFPKLIFDIFDRPFFLGDIYKEILARNNEYLLSNNAKYMLVNSPHYSKLMSLLNHSKSKIIMTATGYDISHFKPLSKRNKKTTIGFAGAISDRIDFNLLEKVISNNSNLKFIFAGPIIEDPWFPDSTRVRDFLAKVSVWKHIKIIECKTRKKQNQIMQKFDIGIIPYDLRLTFNRNCTPTKYFEYCALGIPVISSKILTLEKKPWLHFYESAGQFQQKIQYLLKSRSRKKYRVRQIRFAKQHNIDKKMEAVLRLV